RFRCGGAIVEHRVWLEPGADTVYLAWKLEGEGSDAWLGVTFFANNRDHHGETWPPGFNPEISADGARLTSIVRDRVGLHLAGSPGHVGPRGVWCENFALPIERERGLGDRDSALNVADGFMPLMPGAWAGYAVGLAGEQRADLEAALTRRFDHDRAVLA